MKHTSDNDWKWYCWSIAYQLSFYYIFFWNFCCISQVWGCCVFLDQSMRLFQRNYPVLPRESSSKWDFEKSCSNFLKNARYQVCLQRWPVHTHWWAGYWTFSFWQGCRNMWWNPPLWRLYSIRSEGFFWVWEVDNIFFCVCLCFWGYFKGFLALRLLMGSYFRWESVQIVFFWQLLKVILGWMICFCVFRGFSQHSWEFKHLKWWGVADFWGLDFNMIQMAIRSRTKLSGISDWAVVAW